ncbi:hypothetical protein TNCV_623681 [Trichonephila clavipes]|nr:hypothetical protein TNCV_623681 [Trichonephila clavipes]
MTLICRGVPLSLLLRKIAWRLREITPSGKPCPVLEFRTFGTRSVVPPVARSYHPIRERLNASKPEAYPEMVGVMCAGAESSADNVRSKRSYLEDDLATNIVLTLGWEHPSRLTVDS